MTTYAKISIIAIVLTVLAVFHGEAVKIAISHCNDVSGQIETYKNSTNWTTSRAPEECIDEQEYCVGGLINVVHWLHQTDGPNFNFKDVPKQNIFRFISGNLIGGESGWVPSKGESAWKDYGTLVQKHIQPTAAGLGMKEFGAGLRQTIDYATAAGFENFALANTCEGNITGKLENDFCESIKPSIKTFDIYNEKDIATTKIGVIGFTTPTVERLSLPGQLKFLNVADKIQQITNNDKSGVKSFIAIGDGNLDMAREIIEKATKVKLVIYGAGFSNTRNMSDVGPYPLPHKNGFIATAGRYGSSVGKLVLDVNENTGEFKVVSKALILTKRADPLNDVAVKVNEDVTKWRGPVETAKKDSVGHTRVNLEGGENCWRNECNLGNLMTDAVVHCVLSKPEFTKPFPYPLHSIWHGGAFFEDLIQGAGDGSTADGRISKFDIHKWLPYHNNVYLVKILGKNLLQVFDKSASGIDPKAANEKDWRQFLQVSNGLEVHYDTKGIPKVTRVRMVHDDKNGVPAMSDIQNNTEYYMAIPTYLYEGRGVYNFAKDYWKEFKFDTMTSAFVEFDDNCLERYIRALKQVSVGFEERIWINSEDGGGGSGGGSCKGSKTAVTVVLTIIFFSMFLAIIYVGYFYVIPRLRTSPVEYPPNQL